MTFPIEVYISKKKPQSELDLMRYRVSWQIRRHVGNKIV